MTSGKTTLLTAMLRITKPGGDPRTREAEAGRLLRVQGQPVYRTSSKIVMKTQKKNPSWNKQANNFLVQLGMTVHSFNPSAWKAEAEGFYTFCASPDYTVRAYLQQKQEKLLH